jgi:hypothetical protein
VGVRRGRRSTNWPGSSAVAWLDAPERTGILRSNDRGSVLNELARNRRAGRRLFE